MDFSKLTTGHKIALGGLVAVIVSLVLPWFEFGPIDRGPGGLGWLGILLTLAGVVVLALKAFGTNELSLGTLKPEQIALVLTGLGAILIILKLLTGDSPASRSLGVYLATIGGLAAAYGAFAAMKEAGIAMPSADDFNSIAGGDDGGES